jgi:hypothetical protein
MVKKSPDEQWNRQNCILFHETIPLKLINTVFRCKGGSTLYRPKNHWQYVFQRSNHKLACCVHVACIAYDNEHIC